MTSTTELSKLRPRNVVRYGVQVVIDALEVATGRPAVPVVIAGENTPDPDAVPLRPLLLPLRLVPDEDPPDDVFEGVVFVELVSTAVPPFDVPDEIAGGFVEFDAPPLLDVSVTTGVPDVLPPFEELTETEGVVPVDPPFVEPDEISGAEALEPPLVDVVVIEGASDEAPPLLESEEMVGAELFDELVDPPFEESLATLGVTDTVTPVSSARAMLIGEKVKKREMSEKAIVKARLG